MSVSGLISVTDETFAQVVLASDRPVTVDFWAEWCPPCHRIAPVLAELAAEFGERMTIAKIDTDKNPASMRAYGVMSLPTLLVFQNGTVTGTIVGAKPKATLRDLLLGYAGLS